MNFFLVRFPYFFYKGLYGNMGFDISKNLKGNFK